MKRVWNDLKNNKLLELGANMRTIRQNGEGGEGMVFVVNDSDSRDMAIKLYPATRQSFLNIGDNPMTTATALREFLILRRMNTRDDLMKLYPSNPFTQTVPGSHHIVRCGDHNCATSASSKNLGNILYILMPYMSNVLKGQPFDAHFAKLIVYQHLLVADMLAKNKLRHGDINNNNSLTDKDGWTTIIDWDNLNTVTNLPFKITQTNAPPEGLIQFDMWSNSVTRNIQQEQNRLFSKLYEKEPIDGSYDIYLIGHLWLTHYCGHIFAMVEMALRISEFTKTLTKTHWDPSKWLWLKKVLAMSDRKKPYKTTKEVMKNCRNLKGTTLKEFNMIMKMLSMWPSKRPTAHDILETSIFDKEKKRVLEMGRSYAFKKDNEYVFFYKKIKKIIYEKLKKRKNIFFHILRYTYTYL
eukprot:GHVL01001338.1.p1 GENE.GHVL01001338.1~~GHVL01001338.1.p1  ORF type:complete len:441 (+),score=49.09 GHVL01001338.1:94-1323(+)